MVKMWIFTRYGFFSAVSARKTDKLDSPVDKTRIMVRARSRKHLQNLVKRFKLRAQIRQTSLSDYPFRIFLPKAMWNSICLELADEIDYDNFKKEVGIVEAGSPGSRENYEYLNALHAVWQIMRDHEEFL